MTPAARVAAAIEVLDLILDGSAPEKALTGWGRSNRFAGSKDRAAIRDHVFDALRCRSSYAWRGGAQTGRGIMLGAMRSTGLVDDMFTAVGHAPAVVEEDEGGGEIDTAPRSVRMDMPDWLLSHFDEAQGKDADRVLALLQTRAGVFLRVNIARTDTAQAKALLAKDNIKCEFIQNIDGALQAVENERRIALSDAYLSGLVELQDTSSQVAISSLGITAGQRVLDYCAGGGGKSLAMAALGADVTAHDIDVKRMTDIAPRAARAGVAISTVETDALSDVAPFDLVLCDAPCSGSGTWRRTPAAKWDLTDDRLAELTAMQDDVFRQAAPLVAVGGCLAYATCSVFKVENEDRVQAFVGDNPNFEMVSKVTTVPHDKGDGFFLTQLKRKR